MSKTIGPDDCALTIPEAQQELNKLGFKHSIYAVRRMATEKKLPFFAGLDGRKLFIMRSILHAEIAKRQHQAQRG